VKHLGRHYDELKTDKVIIHPLLELWTGIVDCGHNTSTKLFLVKDVVFQDVDQGLPESLLTDHLLLLADQVDQNFIKLGPHQIVGLDLLLVETRLKIIGNL